jgi:glycosyltransferase involved in cell wall biosynthesis
MPGRVLVVAYNFPPVGGVGVQRTLKYVTYLPRGGWEPVVLTARNPGRFPRDEEAERRLPPDLVVERAFSPEPVKLRRSLGRAARRLRGHAGAGTAGGDESAASAGLKSGVGSSNPWSGRLLGPWAAATRLTFFPDEEVGWVPFAIRRGLEINRREHVDAIYSSSGPISCHLVAAMVAHRTGLPWIADFRDPWIGNAFAAPMPALHARLQRRIERRIVHLADRAVFATSGLVNAYAARYPGAASRFLAIPNGYDRSDFPAFDATTVHRRPDGRFRLVYGGSVYGEQELEMFLTGLELLVAHRPEIRDRLEIEFVGWLNLRNQAIAVRYSAPDRLGSMLQLTGFLPHSEAVARFAAADALLQLIADGPNRGQIQGGKLMEYIGLDRQILAIVPEGQAREMLRELNWGIAVDPTPEAVADGVERLLATPVPQGRADPEGRYDRVNLARRLAELLDEVVAGQRGG